MSIPVPEYMRIRQYVMNRIYNLTEPEKLPSEREMGELFNVCRKTVRRAFSDLIREGRIISKSRSGHFAQPADKSVAGKNIGILFASGMSIRYSRQELKILGGISQALCDRFAYGEILNISSLEYMGKELSRLSLDGLLWVNAHPDKMRYYDELIRKAEFPVMTISFFDIPERGNWIHNSFADLGCAIVDYLVKLGHEKVLFAGHNLESPGGLLTLIGFKQALKKCGITFKRKLLLKESEGIKTELRSLMRVKPLPFTAVFCWSGHCKMIYDIADQEGLDIPNDFSLITEEDAISLQLGLNPTRMRRPVATMAYEAIDKMLDIVENEIAQPVRLKFDWEIQPGDSCRRI